LFFQTPHKLFASVLNFELGLELRLKVLEHEIPIFGNVIQSALKVRLVLVLLEIGQPVHNLCLQILNLLLQLATAIVTPVVELE